MTLARSRTFVAAILAVVAFSLAGCADPSPVGSPGVAAVYDGHEVTNSEVQQMVGAWTELDPTHANYAATSLTLELLRPAMLQAARDAGNPVTDALVDQRLANLLLFKNYGGDAPAGLRDAVEAISALIALLESEEGFPMFRVLIADVEANAIVSPRYGHFSQQLLEDSLSAAFEEAGNQGLGEMWWSELQDVLAFYFVNDPEPWIGSENKSADA